MKDFNKFGKVLVWGSDFRFIVVVMSLFLKFRDSFEEYMCNIICSEVKIFCLVKLFFCLWIFIKEIMLVFFWSKVVEEI